MESGVENGSKIRIWNDKWIPSPSSFQVLSLIKNPNDSALVLDLLEKGGLGWNKPLVLDTFWPEGAEVILNISVSKRSGEDKII